MDLRCAAPLKKNICCGSFSTNVLSFGGPAALFDRKKRKRLLAVFSIAKKKKVVERGNVRGNARSRDSVFHSKSACPEITCSAYV